MQKKKLLVAYYGDTPECVEGFPKGCERSCEGSLMFKRGKKRTITLEEYEYIKKKYSHMTPNLRLIAEKIDKPKPKKEDDSKEKESSEKKDEAQSGEDSSSSKDGKKASKKVSKKVSRRS